MQEIKQIFVAYHMYLKHLESALRQSPCNLRNVGLFLNVLHAIQDEEFCYDMENPRLRWSTDYTLLDVDSHRDVLLLQIEHEKDQVDTLSKEFAASAGIDDAAVRSYVVAQIHRRLFWATENVVRMAQRFLWEDEILEDNMVHITATLRKRDDRPAVTHGNASSFIDKERITGLSYLRLEDLRNVLTPIAVDRMVALGVTDITSNRLFRRRLPRRTCNGISKLTVGSDRYVKIQDAEGVDFLILTRDSRLYIDDLQL